MINNLLTNTVKPIQINGVYLISGIYDLAELQHTSVNKDNILSIDVNNVDELSPLKFNFDKWSDQRFFVNVYVAEHDSPTFVSQIFFYYRLISIFSHKKFITDKTRLQVG